MSPWFWILVGVLASPIIYLGALVLVLMACRAVEWIDWKRRQIRCRREWIEENPYWREAFEAGAKWAREGESHAVPNLTQLRMPEAEE